MTVELTSVAELFTGTGSAASYGTGIYAQTADQIKVYADGALQVLNTDYTLTGLLDEDGVQVDGTFASGVEIMILRETQPKQQASILNNETVLQEVIERGLDHQMLVSQEIAAKVGRALLVPVGEAGGVLPSAVERANGYLKFDSAGNPETFISLDVLSAFTVEDGQVIFTNGGVRSVMTMTAEAGTLTKRIILPYNGIAGLNTFRFGSIVERTVSTGLLLFSGRDDAVNNDELGHQLMSAIVNINTFELTDIQVVEDTAFTAAGGGAVWAGQLLPLAGSTRVLAFYNHINSPDGDYAHIDARSDICLRYTEDYGENWSARQVISAGENANVNFGWPDYNAAGAGANIVGGTNTAVQMTDGRIVIAIYFAGSGGLYLGLLYTDDPDGWTGWAHGASIAMNPGVDTEPQLALASDGTLILVVRREDGAGRSIYTSTNAEDLAFDRVEAGLPRSNTAAAAIFDGNRLIVAGPDSLTNNRMSYKVAISRDDAGSFVYSANEFFNPVQHVGYSSLTEWSTGEKIGIYETNSVQGAGSFNQMGSLGILKTNNAFIDGSSIATAAPHDSTIYDADEEGDLFVAYVTDDGGTIDDEAGARAAIATAIEKGYWSSLGFVASPFWGRKNMGAATTAKLYSLNRKKNDSSSAGTALDVDTTTTPDTIAIANATVFAQFDDMPIRKGPINGAVVIDRTADTNFAQGSALQWTTGGGTSYFWPAGAVQDGAVALHNPPGFSTNGLLIAHYSLDHEENLALAGHNGVWNYANGYFASAVAVDETADMQLTAIGGPNRRLAELWFFNGPNTTHEMIRQCGADRKASGLYP